jgi:hypothetical protein
VLGFLDLVGVVDDASILEVGQHLTSHRHIRGRRSPRDAEDGRAKPLRRATTSETFIWAGGQSFQSQGMSPDLRCEG